MSGVAIPWAEFGLPHVRSRHFAQRNVPADAAGPLSPKTVGLGHSPVQSKQTGALRSSQRRQHLRKAQIFDGLCRRWE